MTKIRDGYLVKKYKKSGVGPRYRELIIATAKRRSSRFSSRVPWPHGKGRLIALFSSSFVTQRDLIGEYFIH
ncbi:MAG: hypothetical protein WC586_12720 [Methanoregula sp.]